MREIKFRIWEGKRMLHNGGLAIKGNTILVEDKGSRNLSIPMQFTGRKDKNDKEIYEGDIIKESNISDGEHIRKVIFERGCFWTEGNDGNGSQLYIPLKIEVIGNVWENPELLNEAPKEK